jgi:diguanylate cyclase (GGDEF)-like protein
MNETKKNSILVIDDAHSNILALMHILGDDYTIYAKKNGKDGIKIAADVTPDIIMLDIIMPEMDGYEVLAELKKSEMTKNIPVIFITGLRDSGDETKGLALGAADYITKPFVPEIVKLRIQNQIQIVNQIRTIQQLSMTDQLTGLPNRRYFDARFKTEWARAYRDHAPLSILVADIDKFKNYNDSYGHQQGDMALIAFAQVFMEPLKRAADFAARWGGEEFIALLPNTDSYGALNVAEKIRKSIEDFEVPRLEKIPESAAKITVSIGANTQIHGDESTVMEFFAKADEALYESKKNGRNQSTHYGDTINKTGTL